MSYPEVLALIEHRCPHGNDPGECRECYRAGASSPDDGPAEPGQDDPGEMPTPAPEAVDTSWQPIDLDQLAHDVDAGRWQPPAPTIGALPGRGGLLYPGLTHWLAGESGVGKSMFATWQAADVIRAGGLVAWIDYESNPGLLAHRFIKLCGLKAPELVEQLLYLRPKSRFGAVGLDQVATHLAGQPTQNSSGGGHPYSVTTTTPRLVVVDSFADALGLQGYDRFEDEDQRVRQLMRGYFEPIAEVTGAAALVIDHTPKYANGKADHATGTLRKRAALTGAHFGLEGRAAGDDGATLRCAKDRNGGIPQGVPLATWRIGAGGHLSLSEPDTQVSKDERRKGEDNALVAATVREFPGQSFRQLTELTGLSRDRAAAAVRRLVNLAAVEVRDGAGNAKEVHPL